MGISILPPDINKSGLKFTPETVAAVADRLDQEGGAQRAPLQYNAIRYGLAAIKNVGEAAMAMAIREREQCGDFASLEDFCGRLDSRVANRKLLESLIKAGAFDFTRRDRPELFACIEDALASSAALQRDRVSGQVSLFDQHTHAATATRRQPIKSWSEHEKLSYEKELLGFYVSGHRRPGVQLAAGFVFCRHRLGRWPSRERRRFDYSNRLRRARFTGGKGGPPTGRDEIGR